MESTPEPVASATWDQPVPGDPSPYVVHQEELMRMRKKQGLEGNYAPGPGRSRHYSR